VILPLHAGLEGAGPWTAWEPQPLVLVVAAAVLGAYALGWRRLRGRGRPDLASVPKAVAFAAGVLVIVLALVSPLDHVGEEYLLSAHMTQHMLIMDAGPLLIALGLAGPLALFVVPRPALRRLGRPRPRAVLARLASPWVAFAAWTAVMVVWHVPAAFELALNHRWAHDLEHVTMIAAGLAVWMHIVAVLPRARMSHARRAAYAMGLFAIGMVVSEVLFLSDPLYARYVDQPDRLLGLSPTADQSRAALIMTAEQMLTMVTAAALLVWAHVEGVAQRDAGPRAVSAEGPPGPAS
jgi:cytochrome c oxidase assembly factor CtaG